MWERPKKIATLRYGKLSHRSKSNYRVGSRYTCGSYPESVLKTSAGDQTMSFLIPRRLKLATNLLTIALFAVVADHSAYSQAVPQVTTAVDSLSFSPLKGSVHAVVRLGAKDLGAVPDETPTGTLTLLLQRPAEQEQQLEQYLRGAHTPGSPNYHKWLTPQEFGKTYGVADSDLSAVAELAAIRGIEDPKK